MAAVDVEALDVKAPDPEGWRRSPSGA